MSLSSTVCRVDRTGLGNTATYSFDFYIFSKTELRITKITAAGVESELIVDVDFSVSGVQDEDGGTITLLAGNLPSGDKLIIRRVLPLTQETDLRNQANAYRESVEDQFDRLVMIDQQQQADVDRSVKLHELTSLSGFDLRLPKVLEANRTIIVNDDGDGFDLGPTAQDLANAQANADAAAASAAAATAVQAAAEANQAAADAAASAAAAQSANAANDAASAAASASSAATNATTASNAATAAAGSATAAAGSATSAANSGTAASLSETNAANSASAAATSATNAANSATAAANSAAAAVSAVASQTGNSGKFLKTDGTNTSWALPTKTDVGLGNVDNTSDANKPVSTAQATAIGAKLSKTLNLSDVASPSTALNNLLPAQTGNNGKYLKTDGSAASWADVVATLSYASIDGQTAKSSPTSSDELLIADVAASAMKKITLGQVSGWWLLSNAFGSGFSFIDFVNLDSTYESYIFEITDLTPSTTGNLLIRFSTDNGSTFISAASSYRHSRIAETEGGALTVAGSTGDTAIVMAGGITATAGHSYTAQVRISNPSGSKFKTVTWTGAGYIGTNFYGAGSGTYVTATTAINAIRFIMSAGTMSGTIKMYGVRKS